MLNMLVFVMLLLCLSCNTDETDLTHTDIPFPAPSNLIVTRVNDNTLRLTWDDNSTGEEGFVIERSKDNKGFIRLQTTQANVTEYIDKQVGKASYVYRVYAYYKSRFTEMTAASYTAPIQIELTSSAANYARISAVLTLQYSANEDCRVGLCWSETEQPTTENAHIIYPEKVTNGKVVSMHIPNIVLDYNTTYYIRAFASNSKGTAYSTQITRALTTDDKPQAITLPWRENSAVNATMPPEVRVYESTNTTFGHPLKAWYAIADLSTGNVILKTNYVATKMEVGGQMRQIGTKGLILVNGGYFDTAGTSSFSLLIDKGVVKSNNIATLTRSSFAYPITRAAFGVDAQGTPSAKWVYSIPAVMAYDCPALNIEGIVPYPTPSSSFPVNGVAWNMFSAVGGGPMLIFNHKIVFDYAKTLAGKYISNYEMLQSDIFNAETKQPRTSIGYTADNKVIIFVCDGRQLGISEGITIDELATVMLGLGCTHAIHLDGGGSTTLIVNPNSQLINHPVGGTYQRPVSTTVGFMLK